MLWIGDITYWAGWPERTITMVLNTQRMSKFRDLTLLQVLKTQFLYSEWTEHKRGDLKIVEVNDSLAHLLVAMDVVPPHVHFTVNIYPDDDITQTAVAYTFRYEDIDRCHDANQITYPGCSWLYMVLNETRRKRYLIDMLAQTFIDLVDTGTTTTSTD